MTLIVDEKSELKELRAADKPEQLPVIRVLAKLISYLFHPVFIPVYVVIFLVYFHPYLFIGFTPQRKLLVIIQAALMYSFFPLVSVLLLKALKFVDSIFLHTQKDRIIPLVVCGIWYFWIWNVWRNLDDYPREIVVFAMANFLASSVALFLNIYMKISLHAIAVGVMVAFVAWLGLSQGINAGIYVSLALMIAGLVCTARFVVSDHSEKEVYLGLVVGGVGLVAGNLFA